MSSASVQLLALCAVHTNSVSDEIQGCLHKARARDIEYHRTVAAHAMQAVHVHAQNVDCANTSMGLCAGARPQSITSM